MVYPGPGILSRATRPSKKRYNRFIKSHTAELPVGGRALFPRDEVHVLVGLLIMLHGVVDARARAPVQTVVRVQIQGLGTQLQGPTQVTLLLKDKGQDTPGPQHTGPDTSHPPPAR